MAEKKESPDLRSAIPIPLLIILVITVISFRACSNRAKSGNHNVVRAPSCEEWGKQYAVINESNFPTDTIRVGKEKRVRRILRIAPREKWLLVLHDTTRSGIIEFDRKVSHWDYKLAQKTWVTSISHPSLRVLDAPGIGPIQWGLRKSFVFNSFEKRGGCVLLLGEPTHN